MNRSGKETTLRKSNGPGTHDRDNDNPAERTIADLALANPIYDSISGLRKGEALSGSRPAEVLNLQRALGNQAVQRLIERSRQAKTGSLVQRKEGTGEASGLPDSLKTKIESLSGVAMDDVQVHYNSDKPAQLQAHAYAQGSDIFVGPGQEKHLPHEAWHVVQQRQGRVQPTMQMKKEGPINDNEGLEHEADEMGAKALSLPDQAPTTAQPKSFVPLAAGQTSGPIQLKRYTVSRNLPLEPHFREWKNTKEDIDKARIELLGKVRQAYPLTPELEETANREKWSADKRDENRGPGFNEAKMKILEQLKPGSDSTGDTSSSIWTRDAHVAGLSVASERERANTPESTLTKKITKIQDWIGAHLIKRAWGGEDNMWNVVSWPKAAEDKWGKEFEGPIDIAFSVNKRNKLDISLEIEKEDEAIPAKEISELITKAQETKGDNENWQKAIGEDGVKAFYEANRAIESIPVSAKGTSEISKTNLEAGDTKWNEAVNAARTYVTSIITNSAKKAPHQSRKLVGQEEAEKTKKSDLYNERSNALYQERTNYRPERYDVTHELDGGSSEPMKGGMAPDPVGLEAFMQTLHDDLPEKDKGK
ncbi:MAG: DUF4157 domain-containing protein [Chloroflexi bacterium]|nr:DUF4157 domain-containing protein [Chloroflexota bacterium]OJV95232.1 MAG: hypothetical protein BGO39_24810 [Chloroflexi bacterium 54-19]